MLMALCLPNIRGQGADPEPPLVAPAAGTVQVWLTTYDAARKLERQSDLTWSGAQSSATFNVAVDESLRYQQMDGFGASITDDAIWSADPPVRDEIMRLLFSRCSGIGMNMIRVPMRAESPAGTATTYDEMPPGQTDPTLASFSIAGDLQWKIPMMQRAKELNPELTLMGTPWSAPYWMKDSGAMGYGRLLPQYFGTYANYFVKWIQAWRDHGLGISAVTMQNEPHYEPYSYPGMLMDPADQIAFALRLGPAIHDAGFSTRIICWDHNFDEYSYPIAVLNDADARQWIDGSAFHAYAGDPVNMGYVKAAHPDKNLYFTEQTGSYPGDGFGGSIQWHVKNLFMIPAWNFSRCTLIWQLALSSTNLSGDRPFVRVAADGKSYQLFGEYYETGHFSKFVRKGAYRIAATTAADGMPRTVAYQNPDGSKVLVALNDSNSNITVSIQNGGRWVSYPMAGGSLASFVWRDTADGNGLAATYYDRADLTGVTESRIDPVVDFNWGPNGTPDPSLGDAGFSARWTGKLLPPTTETYTFHTATSDGVRLWVDNKLVIDQWQNQGVTMASGSLQLTANQAVDIKMEYCCTSGTGVANLAWSSPSHAKQTIPRSQLYAPSTASAPPPPLQLGARCPGGGVALGWTAAPTATAYTVRRGTTGGGPYDTVLTSRAVTTSYTDTTASAGTTYYYVVSGVNAAGTGEDSAEACATPSTALPAPWAHQDIGAVNSTGNAGTVGSSLMIASAGNDIWNTADSCHFVFLPMTGNGTITARVAAQEASDSWTKSGVMMRESLAANSAQVTVAITPMRGVHWNCRPTTGAATTGTTVSGPFPPHWVKLTRSGTTFTGYNSLDGNSWTQVGSPVDVAMANSIYVGLAVSSHSPNGVNITAFDSVGLSGFGFPMTPTGLTAGAFLGGINLAWDTANQATGYTIKRALASGGPYTVIATTAANSFLDLTINNRTTYYYVVSAMNAQGESGNTGEAGATSNTMPIPTGWTDRDMGDVGSAGYADYANGTFTTGGSGADIWNKADAFNFCYQTVSGSGVIGARVTAVGNTNTSAKAGVMFRESMAVGSKYAMICATPGSGIKFEYRSSTNGTAKSAATTTGTVPVYLKLTRTGNSFKAYYGADGSNWTQLGSAVTISMATDACAGLATCATNNSALAVAAFDNLLALGYQPAGVPAGVAATAGNGRVALSWTAVPGATGYYVKRAITSGGPYVTMANPTDTGYADSGVTGGTTYYYVVSAHLSGAESANSSETSATPSPAGSAIWAGDDNASWGSAANWLGAAPTDNGSGNITFNQSLARSSVNNLTNLAVNPLTFSAGAGTNMITGNPLLLAGSILVDATQPQEIDTPLVLTGNRTVNVVFGGRLALNGRIQNGSGGGAITKAGAGTLVLNGSNSFAGVGTSNLTFLSGGGTVIVTDPNALGSVLGGHYVGLNGGGALDLQTDTPFAAFNASLGSNSTAATVIVNRKTVGAGALQAFGNLDIGSTTLNFVAGSNVTGGTAAISLANVRLTAGNNDRPATLAGNAGITIGTASIQINALAKRLQLDGTHPGNRVSGVISDGISTLSLIKANTGTWTLSGDNRYTGSTTVSGGTLVLTKACLSDTAQLAISANGILRLDHGATDRVGSLVLGGSAMPDGIYDGSNCAGRITGTGKIQVGALTVPIGLAVIAGSGQAALGWTGLAGATRYNIKRATTKGGPYATVAVTTGTNYADSGFTIGTIYYYAVSAVIGGVEGGNTAGYAVMPVSPVTRVGLEGGNVVIRMISEPECGYQMQRRDTLAGGRWEDVGLPVTGTGETVQLADTNANLPATRFYRVRITIVP